MNSAAAGAIAAVAAFFLLYFPDQDDGSGAVLGALAAGIGVAIAWEPAIRYRALPRRSSVEIARLLALSLGLGVALGVGNLLVNYAMAASQPAIHDQMVTRWAEFSPWSVVGSGPLIEEIAFRLVLLSLLAWLAARFTDDRQVIARTGLGISALLFGIAHVFYGGVEHPMYIAGMAAKSSAAGLLLGWIFWRWGLPYSSVCHCTANGVHLLLMPALF